MSEEARPSIELQLLPASTDYATHDARWQNQVQQLLTDLRRNAGEVRKEITPVPGRKGGAEAIILALGTSGAVSAAVTVFRAWLSRSADRKLTIRGRVDGREIDLRIDGRNVTERSLLAALGFAQK